MESENQYNEELIETARKLRENLDIIKSIAKAYHSLYYIDLVEGTYLEQGTSIQKTEDIIGRKGDVRVALETMVRYIIAPEQRDEVRTFVDLSTLNERLKGKEWISQQFLGSTGMWSEGYFSVSTRDENGDCTKVIFAVRDINENKKKELAFMEELAEARKKAEAASKAKTSFLFNMSHDIRTPMNAILGYTDLLENSLDDPEKCADYIEKIRFSGDFLLSLINDVLEFARIESGKVTLNEKSFKIGLIGSEVDSVYTELLQQKNINFTHTIETQTEYVYGDIVKLQQIHLNIASNAYKYTPEGGSFAIRTTELPSDRPGYAMIKTTFTDTGVGMSEEYQKVIFEEFTREHTVTENRIQGTGLGMPIVKKLVDLMDGTITVESQLGKGTTFTVIIPHRIAEAPEKQTAGKADAETYENLPGKRALLAEDNALNAEIAAELLKRVGVEVDWAMDGAICVEMMEKSEPRYYDLILMDVQMPNMDGYQATKMIRAMAEPDKREIPIIAMTANAFEEDRQNAFRAGMNEHLAKPIKAAVLYKTLNDIMV